MTYLFRVATVTLRALKGVIQLVLMCARTPDAVRNCKSAMSSRSATALESCGWTSTISESVNQRIRSISCTARSITTPTRSEEHTSELQSQFHLVCRLLLEKKK